MSRLGGVFWFVLVIATGMTNFLVKQTVQNLDDQLAQVRHKTTEDQKKIHDLVADWTFLNQPEHLADLNNRYVHLEPMSPKQVVTSLDSIPMRPVPPPEETAPPVAEVSAPPTPTPAVETTASPAPAAPPRAPIASVSATTVIRAPATTPLSLISTAHAATVPSPAPAARTRPAPAPAAAQPPSLDAIFAQVAGNR